MKQRSENNLDNILYQSRKAQTPSNQNYINNQSQFKSKNFYDLNPSLSQNHNQQQQQQQFGLVQKQARSMTFNAINQQPHFSTQQQNPTTLLASKSKLGSIYRGVRKGDITEIIGPKAAQNKTFLPSLQKGNKSVSNNDGTREFIFEERDTMQNEKVKIRKELDKWLYEINVREKEIKRLKSENEDFQKKKDYEQNQGNFLQLEKGVIKENGLQTLEQKHLVWKKSKYEFMKQRLAKDSVVFKYRQNTIEEEIKLIEQEIKKLKEQVIRVKEFNGNSEVLVQELHMNLIAQQKEKEEIIEKLLVGKDQDNFKEAKSQIRQQNQKVQADIVKFGKTPQEEKYRHFYFCNKLAKQILQCKMKKLLQKYEDVEKVFLKIKAATGTQSIYDILEIFIERDELYQSLQAQIQNNKEKVDSIDKTIEVQNKYIKELLKERENFQNQLKKPQKEEQQKYLDLTKQYEQSLQQSQFNELQEQKLYNWVITNLIRLDKIQGIQLDQYLEKSQIQSDNQKLQQSQQQSQLQQSQQQQQQQNNATSINQSKINEVSNEQDASSFQNQTLLQQQQQQEQQQQLQQNNSKLKENRNWREIFPQEKIAEAFQLLSDLILTNITQSNQDGDNVEAIFKNIQQTDISNTLYQQEPQFFQKNTRIDLEKKTQHFLKSQTKQQNLDFDIPQQDSESLAESSTNINSNLEEEEINHMEYLRQKVQMERQQLQQQRRFEEERLQAEKKKKEEQQQ
ncbi:hypothetical protein PPERSA_08772 [Pseudocohnilembus persalinus]|uniref:Uncharacterized protein n=1 Tax=Pseudocohnilembus persalinus TaxID=266149 RepID=A0A0V0R7J0_PSEPJ|nr:hypothetical protein PPERSA_08772 [Pseudocohnilembus persalinus]|eukprot:KRX10470.1 hypothetical protein PPERSA_08772 [Pseudocohnilembus persalinus]